MAVNLRAPEQILPVAGIRVSAVPAGIRYKDRSDLALIELVPGSRAAAMFTRNAFRAAPVTIAQRHLARRAPRYLIINAGNANAGTGEIGLEDALACCAAVARQAGCDIEEVLPFSTGVIGERLAADKIGNALPAAFTQLAPNGWLSAAAAMMTTDTVAKAVSREVSVDGEDAVITGIAKGSGMIRPEMATMLAFIATDAFISQALLEDFLREAVDQSFHRITIDGDTSTNDACILIATGKSRARIEAVSVERCPSFRAALLEVIIGLAQAIVRDGEGATKFITVHIRGATSSLEAKRTAFTVAQSPLVKTAFFASDPNWGRILAAVGRAGIEQFDIERVEIFIGETCVARRGAVSEGYTEAMGNRVMAQPEITVAIDLHRGDYSFHVWSTDLSYDYVRINADYRT
jgi:glutamate N-acetyltransferase/amino-acid N-acetyltransferase